MLKTTLLNGITTEKDKDYTELWLATVRPGVITGLEITTNSISAGIWFIKAHRTAVTPEEDILVKVEITVAEVIDTTGTKKVWIEIDQDNINDAGLNDVNGTTAGSIQTGASYPAGNYIALADIVAGAITDDRKAVTIKAKGVNGGELFFDIDAGATKLSIKQADGLLADLEVDYFEAETIDILTDILINGVGTNTALGLLKLNSSGKVDPSLLDALPVNTIIANGTTGVDINIGEALRNWREDYSYYVEQLLVSNQYIWNSMFTVISFTPENDLEISEVILHAEYQSLPVSATVYITDNSDTILDTSNQVAMTSSPSEKTFTFSAPITLTKWVTYKVRSQRTSWTGNYVWSWPNASTPYYKVTWIYNEPIENMYLSDASDVLTAKFVGFWNDTITNGNPIIINIAWLDDNQSGLTIDEDYYLSNTPGLISITPGTNSVMVGRAISETEILINTWGF